MPKESRTIFDERKFKRKYADDLKKAGLAEPADSNGRKNNGGGGTGTGPIQVEVKLPEEITDLLKDKIKEKRDEEDEAGRVPPKVFGAGLVAAGLLTYEMIKGEIMNIQSGVPGEMLHAALSGNLIPAEHAVVSLPTIVVCCLLVWDTLLIKSAASRVRRMFS